MPVEECALALIRSMKCAPAVIVDELLFQSLVRSYGLRQSPAWIMLLFFCVYYSVVMLTWRMRHVDDVSEWDGAITRKKSSYVLMQSASDDERKLEQSLSFCTPESWVSIVDWHMMAELQDS